MKNLLGVLGGAAVLALLSAPVSAGFSGDTVSADYNWPSVGAVLFPSGTAVVGPGIEFDDIGGFGVGSSPSVDFSDANILVNYPIGWSLSGVGAFDGWVFTDFSASNIIGVSLAGTNLAGFTVANLSFDANHVYADTLGLGNWDPGTNISINVSFASAVPEPETYALMLAGLGLLGWVGRRRKQPAA